MVLPTFCSHIVALLVLDGCCSILLQGGWEAPQRDDSAAAEGDGWETGSNLPGVAGSATLVGGGGGGAEFGDGEGLAASGLALPRPPTRPDVSPPLSGHGYFGDVQVRRLFFLFFYHGRGGLGWALNAGQTLSVVPLLGR